MIPLFAPFLGEYHYRPFITPLPLTDYRFFLAIPLCLAIAIVYKSVRCQSMQQVTRQALVLFVFILVVMVLSAGALAALVNWVN
jgi:hypothetical protein